MTAHELAKKLLAGPDLPVVIQTGSVEDEPEEVDGELRLEEGEFYSRDPNQFRSTKPHLMLD